VGEDGKTLRVQLDGLRARCWEAWGRRRSRPEFDREEYDDKPAPLDSARSVNHLPSQRRPLRTVVGLPERTAGILLARYLSAVNTRRYDRAAKTDDEWATLLARARAGHVWFTEAESDLYHQILGQVQTGWGFRLQTWLHHHSLLKHYDRLYAMAQRGRRGWADEDLWAIEYHLTGLLAGALRRTAELSFCWNDRIFATHNDWVLELRRLADGLERLQTLADEGEQDNDLLDDVFAVLRRAWGGLHVA
jgi:hypothetical protein